MTALTPKARAFSNPHKPPLSVLRFLAAPGDKVYVVGSVEGVLIGITEINIWRIPYLTHYTHGHNYNIELILVKANYAFHPEAELKQISKAEFETLLAFEPDLPILEPRFSHNSSMPSKYIIHIMLPLKKNYVRLLK